MPKKPLNFGGYSDQHLNSGYNIEKFFAIARLGKFSLNTVLPFGEHNGNNDIGLPLTEVCAL